MLQTCGLCCSYLTPLRSLKFSVSTFSAGLGLNVSMRTASMLHVAVAPHRSKYPNMCWKCKRLPNGFCSLCVDLTTVSDFLWGHRKKRQQDGWTAWARSASWIDQPHLHHCNTNDKCCTRWRVFHTHSRRGEMTAQCAKHWRKVCLAWGRFLRQLGWLPNSLDFWCGCWCPCQSCNAECSKG